MDNLLKYFQNNFIYFLKEKDWNGHGVINSTTLNTDLRLDFLMNLKINSYIWCFVKVSWLTESGYHARGEII